MKNFNGDKLFPVYLFEGEEEYLQELNLNLLLEKFPEAKELNYDAFYIKNKSISNVLEIANSFPIMSPIRFVVIKDLENIDIKSTEKLREYIEHPSLLTCLCLFAHKIDKRSRLYKAIEKSGKIIFCKPLFENQIPYWITEYVKNRGEKISFESAKLLAEKLGGNLRLLASEIEKLLIYINEKETITLNEIEEVSFQIKINNIYKLCNAILAKNKEMAINYYFNLTESVKEPLFVLAIIAQQFRKLWMVKSLYQKGIPLPEITKKVNIPLFFLKDFLKMIRNFSTTKLKEIFESFLETDWKIKRGLEEPSLAVELLIIKICEAT